MQSTKALHLSNNFLLRFRTSSIRACSSNSSRNIESLDVRGAEDVGSSSPIIDDLDLADAYDISVALLSTEFLTVSEDCGRSGGTLVVDGCDAAIVGESLSMEGLVAGADCRGVVSADTLGVAGADDPCPRLSVACLDEGTLLIVFLSDCKRVESSLDTRTAKGNLGGLKRSGRSGGPEGPTAGGKGRILYRLVRGPGRNSLFE
jgi:hypothetical protein